MGRKAARRTSAAALFLAAATLACADPCGDDPECGGGVQVVSHYNGLKGCKTVPAGSFMIAARDAWCSPRPDCPFRLRPGDRFSDPQVCEHWIGSQLLAPNGVVELIAAVQAGEIGFDKAKACQCLAAVADTCEPVGLFDAHGACNGIFIGLQPAGSQCSHHGQCAGGNCRPSVAPLSPACPGTCGDAAIQGGDCGATQTCVAGAGCLLGTCVAMTRTAEKDQPCGGLGCADGLFCSWTDGATCQPLLVADTTCELEDDNCALGHYCAPAIGPSATGRVCASRYGAGQVCVRDAEEQETCVAGHVCAGHCLPYAALDEACESAAQCAEDAACVAGKCAALPALGQPCEAATISQTGAACKLPALCDVSLGSCVAPPLAGAACVAGQCAPGLACVAGSCSPGPGLNQLCASAGKTCAFGLACVGGTCQKEVCL